MKLAMCVVILGACLLHQGSAQQNWWETDENGTPTIAASRATSTSTPSTPSTPTQTSSPPANCPCTTTPEYNPVCGDNRMTYTNPAMLECAQRCGQSVKLLFHGRCERLA